MASQFMTRASGPAVPISVESTQANITLPGQFVSFTERFRLSQEHNRADGAVTHSLLVLENTDINKI